MVSWKSLIILKEFKKPSRKFLRVWTKYNRDWNLLRKFWNFHIKISIENWLFIAFLSNLPGPLSFYTALENKTIFCNNFFGFGGGGELPHPPAGAPAEFTRNLMSMKNVIVFENFPISLRCLAETNQTVHLSYFFALK